MDCSPPGSSVHGILQTRILECVALSFLQGIFLTRGSNPRLLRLLHWQAGSLPLAPTGKPFKLLLHPYYSQLAWWLPLLLASEECEFQEAGCFVQGRVGKWWVSPGSQSPFPFCLLQCPRGGRPYTGQATGPFCLPLGPFSGPLEPMGKWTPAPAEAHTPQITPSLWVGWAKDPLPSPLGETVRGQLSRGSPNPLFFSCQLHRLRTYWHVAPTMENWLE